MFKHSNTAALNSEYNLTFIFPVLHSTFQASPKYQNFAHFNFGLHLKINATKSNQLAYVKIKIEPRRVMEEMDSLRKAGVVSRLKTWESTCTYETLQNTRKNNQRRRLRTDRVGNLKMGEKFSKFAVV